MRAQSGPFRGAVSVSAVAWLLFLQRPAWRCLTLALLSVTLSGMTISCINCEQDIGGHDPKCMVDGGWWCERCIYELERDSERNKAFEDLVEQFDVFERMQKRQAGLAAGEDV